MHVVSVVHVAYMWAYMINVACILCLGCKCNVSVVSVCVMNVVLMCKHDECGVCGI